MTSGFLVILDLPKLVLMVDGVVVRMKGGFRGFHGVPPGKHVVESEYYTGDKVRIEVVTAAGEASVHEFFNQPPRLDPADAAKARQFSDLARSGGMAGALWQFPPAGMTTGTEWTPPEATATADAGPTGKPEALTLPETPLERRRYYATVVALTAVAVVVGYFLAGVVVGWLGIAAESASERWVYGVFVGGPLALVGYLVVRSRGFRLVR